MVVLGGVFLGIGLVVFGIAAYKGLKHNEELSGQSVKEQIVESGNIWPDPNAKYISAVPVDLTQIQSISKYRSCAGHVRDGYHFNRELELDRSMKHYFYPIPEFQGTVDKVKVFTPFDGTITYIDYEKDKVGGRPQNGGGLHISPTEDRNASVVLGHIYTTKDYQVGDKVKAGELVGYASLGDKGFDFDIDLNTPGGTNAYEGREILGSIFDHMTDSVLAEFSKYGVTPENTKFTKEYRDASPCGFGTPDEQTQNDKQAKNVDTDGRHNENHVQLVR